MIKINSLIFNYNNKKMTPFVLSVDHLEIYKNEIIAICGENGSGKSTFIEILIGVKPIKSGVIEITTCKPKIAVAFQELDFHDQKIIDIFDFYWNMNNSNKNLNKIIEDFQFKNLINKNFNQISFGQKQRLKFALTTLVDSEIVILDEIFMGLDNIWKQKIIEMIKLSKNQTILFISHDAKEIVELANRILYFQEGQIIKDFKLSGNVKEKEQLMKKHVNFLFKKLEDKTDE